MAVTQQLARVPAAQLAACRHSVAELHELCSGRSAPPEDHRDLNWWPVVQVGTWEVMGVDAQNLAVLRRGLDGAGEVNAAYRDHKETIWEHPVTALEPWQVVEVADALRALTPEAVHDAVLSNREHTAAVLSRIAGGWVGDLPELVVAQHAILSDFYEEAARRQLATVMWWD